jgi:L-threonylcarbamoyladenylate synthase
VVPVILEPTSDNIARCAECLRRGLPVAFPTETVYGLACDARSEAAVGEVYRLKRRPPSNPLIAHVTDAAMAKRVVIGWDKRADRLAELFWPGPLAMIFTRRSEICALSVGGRTSVAVRVPAHPVALQLIAAFGSPLSAPSANRSGRVSPTTAAHVAEEFADAPDLLILDGARPLARATHDPPPWRDRRRRPRTDRRCGRSAEYRWTILKPRDVGVALRTRDADCAR